MAELNFQWDKIDGAATDPTTRINNLYKVAESKIIELYEDQLQTHKACVEAHQVITDLVRADPPLEGWEIIRQTLIQVLQQHALKRAYSDG